MRNDWRLVPLFHTRKGTSDFPGFTPQFNYVHLADIDLEMFGIVDGWCDVMMTNNKEERRRVSSASFPLILRSPNSFQPWTNHLILLFLSLCTHVLYYHSPINDSTFPVRPILTVRAVCLYSLSVYYPKCLAPALYLTLYPPHHDEHQHRRQG